MTHRQYKLAIILTGRTAKYKDLHLYIIKLYTLAFIVFLYLDMT